MARKRYISTEISTDLKLADLAEYGTLPLLLYTWSLPHMDDWGRMSGDARQFKLTVCPALDVSTKDVDVAIDQIAAAGLWKRYSVNGKSCIAIDPEPWFKHQSYISKDKRNDDSGSNFKSVEFAEEHRETPQNTEEHREEPGIAEIQQGIAQIAASFSSSLSPSFSSSPSNYYNNNYNNSSNPYQIFESNGFGKLNATTAQLIQELEDDYSTEWVCRAMKIAIKKGDDKKNLGYVEGILKSWKSMNHPEPWTIDKQPETLPPKVTHINRNRYGQGSRQKNQPPVVQQNQPQRQYSEEERAEMRRKAMELDARANRDDVMP